MREREREREGEREREREREMDSWLCVPTSILRRRLAATALGG